MAGVDGSMGRTRDRASVKTGFRVVGTLGLALGLAQCDRDRVEPAPAPAPPPAPITTSTELSRADLIAALARAASAFAAGADPSAAAGLSGRTFRVRLPFGCSGPTGDGEAAADGLAGWARAGNDGSLTLSARPLDWSQSPLVVPPGATPDWDGVQGFWITRPWLSRETCPVPAEHPASAPAPVEEAADPILLPVPPPSPQTMGLAAILAADSSRLGRRDGAAYRFVVRGTGEAPAGPPAQGYRLVLGGRVGAFPDGRAVRCTARSPEQRPVCVAAVELDVVAFEDAAGARLSEWRPTS